jgi:hypothetical protein
MRKRVGLLLTIFALALPQAGMAKGGVRLEITSRGAAFDGHSFADHGPYERIAGIAHMAIDPLAPENKGIVDLALAPRDGDGLVTYDIDVMILRPRDPAKARRVLLFDVVNRGMKTLSLFNNASMVTLGDTIAEGDGLLMRQGYTLVWAGWQGDVTATGMIGARFPQLGDKVTGRTSTEAIFDNATGDRITLPYPAASLDKTTARLTVQAVTNDPPVTISPSDWFFVDDRHVALKRPADRDAGAIYRFEYVARDPRVMGLGFASTRDFITFLRHADAADGNPVADLAAAPCERDANGACANPGGGVFSSAIAFGASQSGRYIRDFLWQGFNRDLAGRRVFDGLIPFVPGGRRTFTNFRFAEPGRFSRQHEDHDVPGFTFPYAYATLTDPVTGKRDGILRACTQSGTCPKVFHIDTGGEFWQAGASLVGTGGTAKDVAFPANVRAYMIASGAHAPGMTAPMCRLPANDLNYSAPVRALLLAMVDWTTGRAAPPARRWPLVAKGDLHEVSALRTPSDPALGLEWPKVANRPIPPAGKPEWPVLVPTVDADGNDAPGIRLPQIEAARGTYLPWALRKPGFGEGDLCLIFGSYIPFARDKASRGSDPRLSLEERYPQPGSRAQRLDRAVDLLQRDRLLLEEDAAALRKQAK